MNARSDIRGGTRSSAATPRGLTACVVLFLIGAHSPLCANEPVVAWKLGEAGRNGFVVHGPVTLNSGADGAEFRGGHLQLAADDPQLARLGRERFSLYFRVRLTSRSAESTLLAWQSADRKHGFRLFLTHAKDGGVLGFEAAFDWKHPRNDRPLRLAVPLTAVGAERWHDLIVRFSGPKLDLFLDGVLVDEEWPVGALASAAGESLVLGRASHDPSGKSAFVGSIAEIVLWDRALSDAEVLARSGGSERVAQREREILGPERPVTQYWKPRGHNTGVGDCMPFFHDGRWHLYYLIDRHGHGSKWGLGAHQWAHVSTADLVKWMHHPLAVPITDQSEGSICTGSAFAHEGAVHAFYAVRTSDGSPARLTVAKSSDAIHFQKSDWSAVLAAPYSGPPARDPVVFRESATGLFHMLVTTELLKPAVTRRGGCLADLVSRDLRVWEQRDPFLVPGFSDQPECPDYIFWNGWHYLVFSNNGVARYRMSREPLGPWLKPEVDAFDGPQARVMKTAAFTGERRLGAAFLPHSSGGYGGQLVLRELVQLPDGTLGTCFPAELRPAFGEKIALIHEALSGEVQGDARQLRIRAAQGIGVAAFERLPRNFSLKLRVHAEPGTAAFGVCVRGSGRYEQGHELRLEPSREKVGWRNADAGTVDEHEHAALYGVKGMDRPVELELVVKDNILDVCIDGRRTLIARASPAFSGERLFFFVQNGGAHFEIAEVHPLVVES